MSDMPKEPQGQLSLWATIKAVAWSFLGVRKNSEFQADIGRLNPYAIIAVGVVAAFLLGLTWVALVNWVVVK
jgi:hypothetical protein